MVFLAPLSTTSNHQPPSHSAPRTLASVYSSNLVLVPTPIQFRSSTLRFFYPTMASLPTVYHPPGYQNSAVSGRNRLPPSPTLQPPSPSFYTLHSSRLVYLQCQSQPHSFNTRPFSTPTRRPFISILSATTWFSGQPLHRGSVYPCL